MSMTCRIMIVCSLVSCSCFAQENTDSLLWRSSGPLAPVIAETKSRAEEVRAGVRPEDEVELWLATFPPSVQNPVHSYILADAFWRIDAERARTFASQAIDEYPDEPTVRLTWARHLYRTGDFKTAAQFCNLPQDHYIDRAEQGLILLQQLLVNQQDIPQAIRLWNDFASGDDGRRAVEFALCQLEGSLHHELRRRAFRKLIESGQLQNNAYELLQVNLKREECPHTTGADPADLSADKDFVVRHYGEDSPESRLFRGFMSHYTDDKVERLWLQRWFVSIPWLVGDSQELPTDQRLIAAVLQLAELEHFPVTDEVLAVIEQHAVNAALARQHPEDDTASIQTILVAQEHRTASSSAIALRQCRPMESPELAVAEVLAAYRSGARFAETAECRALLQQFQSFPKVDAAVTIHEAVMRNPVSTDRLANAARIQLREPFMGVKQGGWYFLANRLFRELEFAQKTEKSQQDPAR